MTQEDKIKALEEELEQLRTQNTELTRRLNEALALSILMPGVARRRLEDEHGQG